MGPIKKAALPCALIVLTGAYFLLNSHPKRTPRTSGNDQSHSLPPKSTEVGQSPAHSPPHRAPHKNEVLKKNILTQTGEFLSNYGNPRKSPHLDLSCISSVLHIFNSHLKGKTLLPTHSNKSISKVLLGENALGLQFIPLDFKYLNQENELIDRWGTPLNFHFTNINNPEIRSAGEDKILWTDDDLLLGN